MEWKGSAHRRAGRVGVHRTRRETQREDTAGASPVSRWKQGSKPTNMQNPRKKKEKYVETL